MSKTSTAKVSFNLNVDFTVNADVFALIVNKLRSSYPDNAATMSDIEVFQQALAFNGIHNVFEDELVLGADWDIK
jgi:hypothetical protein